MRVAVVMSGELRTARHTLPGIRRFFEASPSVKSVDFYCHAWRQNTVTTNLGPDPFRPNHWTSRTEKVRVPKEDLDFMVETLRPCHRFEDQFEIPRDVYTFAGSQYYGVSAASEMFLEAAEVHYDLVVRCRYDLSFFPGSVFSPGEIEEDAVYSFAVWPDGGTHRMSDYVYFGTPRSMYPALELYHELPSIGPEKHTAPEALLYRVLTERGIRVNMRFHECVVLREPAIGQPFPVQRAVHHYWWNPPPRESGIRLIVFDMDGVLLDTTPLHDRAFNEAVEMMDTRYVLRPHETRAFIGRPSTEKLAHLTATRGLPAELHEMIIRDKNIRALKRFSELAPNPRMVDLVKSLRGSGFEVAVASNSRREIIKMALLRTGLMEHISFYVSAQDVFSGLDVPHPKPDPHIYWRCMEMAGVTSAETLVVEDSEVGRRSAEAAGARLMAVDGPGDVTLESVLGNTL